MTDTPHPNACAVAVLPESLRPYIGVPALNPMQAEAIPRVLGGTRNVVIAAPTGSGKTLVAEVALLHECRERGRAGVYLAPMRAIATEKRDDWQRLEALGVRVYKTTGEDDAFDQARAIDADIIVATPEKWDSISRRNPSPEFVRRIGMIVMDEVHLVDEGQRGAGQEAMLARIPRLFPGARIVAMSGTLANAAAVARWLDADLYQSDWRPIALTIKVETYRPAGQWEQDEDERSRVAAAIGRDTLADGGATLIFCGSRKGVERCAAVAARALQLPAPVRAGEVENPALRQTLAHGVGFHHAGLSTSDRRAVETMFRSGDVKILVATTTVAAGVNLPARAVVVRDLRVGTSDLSASQLLQMAGRAGRPGLETKGYCYVIAPDSEAERVEGMLQGHPIGSRLGDDLATHINTEITLGLIRSRADVEAWYGRTLHRQVTPEKVDLDSPLRYLLAHGFVRDEDGALQPTALGRATSNLMIRAASATALERFIGTQAGRTTDPDQLEQDLLIAACDLPVELDDLPNRQFGDALYEALTAAHKGLRGWAQGRLEYLAVAALLLCGIPVERLPIEGPASVRAAVQRELPRYLGFLARRAGERTPAAPDIMVAPADLAAALEYGIAERGAGGLVEAIKRTVPADQGRLGRVHAEYVRLARMGITTLKEALPFLGAGARALAEALPQGAPTLGVAGEHLVMGIPRARGRLRVHFHVIEPHEIVRTVETGNLRELQVAPLAELGEPGAQVKVAVEVLVSSAAGANAWAYAKRSIDLAIPEAAVDYATVERVLRTDPTADDADEPQKQHSDAPTFTPEWRMSRPEFERLVANVPECVRQAATLLAQELADDTDRIRAVIHLLRGRTFIPQASTTRPLQIVARAEAVTSKEAAELTTALLWAMEIPARPLPATVDGHSEYVCGVLHEKHWYWLPIWPNIPFTVHHDTIQTWRYRRPDASQRALGWDVVPCYRRITPRRLPLTGRVVASLRA